MSARTNVVRLLCQNVVISLIVSASSGKWHPSKSGSKKGPTDDVHKMFIVGWLSASLQAISLLINIVFIVEASRERHSSENRCHFLTHTVALCLSNFLFVFHQLTILDNPIKFMRSALVAQQSIFVTHLIWAAGVVLALSRYMGVAIISLSRMVAQTFNVHMQIKVWSTRVCAFAIIVQFAFPVSYVCAFLLDGPKLLLALHDNSVVVIWGNMALHNQYREICCSILVVLFVISFIAYSIVFMKKFLVKKRRRQNTAARDIEWIVHTIRSDPESEDSSEIIPHHPTVAPFFVCRELHFTIISFITLLVYLYHWIVSKEQLSSKSHLCASIVTSLCAPLMLLIYWTLPHIHRRLLFLSKHSQTFNKLFQFVRSLASTAFCPCTHSRVSEGPPTIQMEQPRFSISTCPNGVPYRRRTNRSKSEDLSTSRIRIATIYMNNEH